MPAVKVYLIRHAQSEENVLSLNQKTAVNEFNEMICGTPTTPLTRWGEFQAQLMVGRLVKSNIERIYSSPFDRAIQTATIIGQELGLTPHLVDDLREILPRQLNDTRKTLSLRKLLVRSYMGLLLPGGDDDTEKLGESYRRAQRVWQQITRDDAREVAVVSHYGLISMLFIALDRNRNWRIISRDLSNGGVSVVVRKR